MYRDNPDAVAALVREGEVHRDVYTSPEVFELEMGRVFGRAWIYVGHESQVANTGDFFTTTIGTAPVVMVRHTDGSIRVLHNRCPHKGTRVANEMCGNVGRFFRCPYHAWSFRTDGAIAAIPLPGGYEQTAFKGSAAAPGRARGTAVSNAASKRHGNPAGAARGRRRAVAGRRVVCLAYRDRWPGHELARDLAARDLAARDLAARDLAARDVAG